jgi:hypothetical protein
LAVTELMPVDIAIIINDETPPSLEILNDLSRDGSRYPEAAAAFIALAYVQLSIGACDDPCG